MARTDFRAAAARRLSEDSELSPAIVSLLTPGQPDPKRRRPDRPGRSHRSEPAAAARRVRRGRARRTGRVDPRARRPPADPRSTDRPEPYQIVAGERRWRASRLAGLASIPALIEEIDDDTALEISIIENLQREDLTPLDEAAMYDRMVHEHGYSIRKLAEKLGKDKGYLENRLRLAGAPPEIRELVSLRKDSLSHAYELMKVEDPKKRRRLTDQVARGELTLIKLREKIDGRPARVARARPTPTRSRPTRSRTSTTSDVDSPERRGLPRPRPSRGTRSPSRTTRSSTPSTSWPRRSRTWSTSCAARTSASPSRRRIGPTSPST